MTNSSAGTTSTLTTGGAGTDATFSGTLQNGSGVLALTKLGTGTLNLSGNNSYTGATIINAGTLALGSANALGSAGTISFAGGVLQYSASNNADYSGRFLTTANQAININTNNQDVTFANALTSSGGTLTKSGTGTLTISNRNTYSGLTTINGGTLKVLNTSTTFGSTSGTLGTGNVAIGSGAVLDFSNAVTAIDTYVVSNLITGAGSVRFSGPDGAITTMGALAGTPPLNSYTGGTTIVSGIVNVAQDSIGTQSIFGTGTVTMTGGALRATGGAKTISNPMVLSGTVGFGASTYLALGGIKLAGNTTITPSVNFGGTNVTWYGSAAGSLLLELGTYDLSFSDVGPNTRGGTLASNLNISLNITGSGGVNLQSTMYNGSAIIFSGASSYTGATKVNAGNLQVGFTQGSLSPSTAITVGTGATLSLNLPTGSTFSNDIANAGTVTFMQSGTTNASGAISGSGKLTQSGAGTTTLSGANSYSGVTTVSSGTLQAGSTGALSSNSSVTLTSMLDLFGNSGTVASLAGTGTITNSSVTAATLTTGGSNANTTFGGILQDNNGPLALTKIGSGTLTLTGTNAFTGAMIVNGGTLKAGSTTALGSTSALTLSVSGATLDLGGYDVTAGSISGAGKVTNSAAGTSKIFTTGGSGTNTLFSGVLENGNGTLGLAKIGVGTLTLSGLNSYAGATAISGGTLKAGSTMALGSTSALTLNASGATLDLGGFDTTIGTLAGVTGSIVTNSAVSSNATLITTNPTGTPTTFSGVIRDGASTTALTKNGVDKLSLAGANIYTGVTTINSGILQLGTGSSNGTLGTGAVSNYAQLWFKRSDHSLIVSNNISGPGMVWNEGTGTVTLSGTNSYTGGTTVNNGTLKAGSTSAFGTNSDVNVVGGSGATLDLGGFSNRIGTLTGDGTVTTNGGNATLTFTNVKVSDGPKSVTATLTDGTGGKLSIGMANSGRILFGGVNTFTGDLINQGGGGSFGVTSGSRLKGGNYAGFIGTDFFYESSADQTLSGNLSGILIQKYVSTTSTLKLTGNNGPLTAFINAGNLQLGSPTALGDQSFVSFGGGTLQYGVPSQTYAATFDSNTANQQVRIDTNGLDVVLASDLTSVGGSLTKLGAGTLTLIGANSYTGATTVGGGTLALDGSLNVGTGAVSAVVASGATLSGTAIITASALSVSGGGTINLTGNNNIGRLGVADTMTAFALNNGRSLSTGSIAANGPIALTTTPGSGASLTLGTNAILSSTATGTAITLAADGDFNNRSGTGALVAVNGRWLVYSAAPGGNVFAGLDSGKAPTASRSLVMPAARRQAPMPTASA